MAKGYTSIICQRFYTGKHSFNSMFASLDKEAPPKKVHSKEEETSILYNLNLRLEVK